jgi:hypothetical protein
MKSIITPSREKRTVDLMANESPEALELIDHIKQNNFIVNHIYSGSSTPILQDNDLFIVGSGNIRTTYCRGLGVYDKNL